MTANSEKNTGAAQTVEPVRLELGRCQRELEACRLRMGELEQAEVLLAGENHLLEMVARGESLPSILDGICRLVEEISSGSLCSILLLDDTGSRLWHGAAPSLPTSYTSAVNGWAIGPESGPCGRATYFKKPVIVYDIAREQLGGGYCDLALAHGLRACLSTPIYSSKRKVLGSFAVLSREPRNPTPEHEKIIAQVTHLAAVAIERKQTEAKLRRSEAYLSEAIDTIPGLVWSVRPGGEVDFLNQRWREYTGLTLEQAQGWGWSKAIHPEDFPGLESYWRSVLASGKPGAAEARLRRFDGIYRWFLFRVVPLYNGAGKLIKWYGQNTDIDERKRAEALVAAEKRLLEMIARGDALNGILSALCRLGEELSGDALVSILLVSNDGKNLRHGAAPGLPKAYTDAIDGGLIGPRAGSCGTAAFRKKAVGVSDIETDPLWDDYRHLAAPYGLRSCWSAPIFSAKQDVLGTFALYSRKPGTPTPEQQSVVEQFAHLASIAIERGRAEEALRRSEAYLAEAQRLSLTGSFGWKTVTGELVWSEETFCIMGFDRSLKPTLEMVFKRVHPDDLALVRQTVDDATRNGTGFDFGHRLLMPDGAVKHLRVVGHPARTDTGGVEFVGAVMDITESRRAEAQLRRSEAELHEAQRLTHMCSWKHDLSSGKVKTSPEVYRIFDIQPEEDASDPRFYFGRIHPEDRPRVEELFARCEVEKTDYETDYRIVLPNGTIRHQHAVGHPVLNDAGELVEFVGTAMDVTEQKQAQDELSAAKARFEGILAIAEDAIISVDSSQRIVLFNRGAEKVFGYSPTEVIGKSLDLLLPQRFAHAHRKHLEEFAGTPEVARVMGQRREVFGLRKDGSEFPGEASISKLDLGGEMVFTVILRDITERKKSAEALHASEHLARGQLDALAHTLDAMAQESDPDKLLEHALRTIVEQFGAHSVSVWVRTDDGNRLERIAVIDEGRFVNIKDATYSGLTFPGVAPHHPVWRDVFRTRQHAVLEDLQRESVRMCVGSGPDEIWHQVLEDTDPDPEIAALKKYLRGLGVRTILFAPMLIAGEVAGIVGIRLTQKRSFHREEIELTRALAHQAMLAIQLMRLTQQSRQVAVSAERNRMARDIHDTLAQGFTGVIMQLEAAKGAMAIADASSVSTHIERAEALARTSLGEARLSVRAMRSRSLVDGTLSTALDELLKRMTNGTELQAELAVQGESRPLPSVWEEGLLRIAQESLTNTLKYAQARRFRAVLSFAAHSVQLQLTDDGRGFDAQTEQDGFGLVGMRERAEQLAGDFILRSSPGQGTEIVIELSQPNATNSSNEDHQA